MLKTLVLSFVLVAGLFSLPCMAGEEEFLQLLSILRDNGTLTEQQYATLIKALRDTEAEADVEAVAKVEPEDQE